MRNIFISAVMLALSSCTTLNPNTESVRTVSQDYKEKHCKFLGMVRGFGAPIEGGISAAFDKARSATADLGGNAMYIAQSSQENVVGLKPTTMQNGRVIAEALKCK